MWRPQLGHQSRGWCSAVWFKTDSNTKRTPTLFSISVKRSTQSHPSSSQSRVHGVRRRPGGTARPGEGCRAVADSGKVCVQTQPLLLRSACYFRQPAGDVGRYKTVVFKGELFGAASRAAAGLLQWTPGHNKVPRRLEEYDTLRTFATVCVQLIYLHFF